MHVIALSRIVPIMPAELPRVVKEPGILMIDEIIRRCAFVGGLAACLVGLAPAGAYGAGKSAQKADRVLFISIAGMHEFDLERFVAAHPASTLAALKKHGISYAKAMAPRPS